MLRIGVADDCPVLIRGLKNLFSRFPKWKLNAVASKTSDLLHLLSLKTTELVLLELEICDGDFVSFVRQLTQTFPHTRVLIYTFNARHDLALRAMQGGASGYVLKQSPEDCLIKAIKEVSKAIKEVSSGAAYLDPALQHAWARLYLSDGAAKPVPVDSLSAREKEVFDALVAGKRPKEIAATLSLSANTVATYQNRIFKKFRVASLAGLFRVVYSQGCLRAN